MNHPRAEIERFGRAVGEEDFGAARRALDDVAAGYDASSDRDRRVQRALAAVGDTSLDPGTREQFNRYADTYADLSLRRSAFFLSAELALADPVGANLDNVRRATTELLDGEDAFEQLDRRIGTQLNNTTVEAAVGALSVTVPEGPHPADEAVTVTVGVANVGDTPANDVSLDIDVGLDAPSGGVTASPETVAVGDVPPRTRVEDDVTVTASAEGDAAVQAAATSSNAGEAFRQTEFEYVAVGTVAATAVSVIGTLVTRIEETDELRRRDKRPLLETLEGTVGTVSEANDANEAGDSSRAAARFQDSEDTLRSFLGRVDDLVTPPDVRCEDASLERTLRSQAGIAIDRLEDARRSV